MEDEGAKNKIINDGKIILKPQLFTTASKLGTWNLYSQIARLTLGDIK